MAKTRRLLVDADFLLYKVAFRTESDIDWGDDIVTRGIDLREAKETIEGLVEGYKVDLKADEADFFLSCPTEDGFRQEIMAEYKLNRKGSTKPVGFSQLRRWALSLGHAHMEPTLEADDLIGIWATEPCDETRIIVSCDKDFMTIPGRFYWLKPKGGIERVKTTPLEAARWHLMQTLMGDAVDGYKGCPGIGKVKAERLLTDVEPQDMWGVVVGAFEKAGLSEEVALLNARMAYILRHGDYNNETGEVKLWKPSNLGE